MNRNYNLDLLKVISSLAVVGLHVYGKAYDSICTVLYYLCSFAVPVFFMCSGYSLLGNNKEITFKYCMRKALKILSVILCWDLLYYIYFAIKIAKLKSSLNIYVLLLEDIVVGSFLQAGYLWQFWYLAALIIVYCFLYLLYKLKKKSFEWFIVVWAFLFVFSVGINIFGTVSNNYMMYFVIQPLRLWSWFQYLILGSLLPSVVPYIKEKISVAVHSMLCVLLAVLECFYQYRLHVSAEANYDNIILIIWCLSLVTLILRINIPERCNKYVLKASMLSFGVYILHVEFIRVFTGLFNIDATVKAVALHFAIVVISSVITYLISLTPANKVLLKL